MRLATTILVLLTFAACKGQTSDGLSWLVDSIANEGIVMGPAVGFSGTTPKQWYRYEELAKGASDSLISGLIDHKSPVVRCYAFMAARDRELPGIYTTVVDHLQDTQKVSVMFGCVLETITVADFFYEEVTGPPSSDGDANLTTSEKLNLYREVVQSPNVLLRQKQKLLEQLPATDSLYEVLLETYRVDPDGGALTAIAKFRRSEDKPKIVAWLRGQSTGEQQVGLDAVRWYPDDEFFPFLLAIQSQELAKPTGFDYQMIKSLYVAAVQYKDAKSRDLLIKTLKEASGSTLKYHEQDIDEALEEHPDEIYNDLRGVAATKRNMSPWLNLNKN